MANIFQLYSEVGIIIIEGIKSDQYKEINIPLYYTFVNLFIWTVTLSIFTVYV